MTLNGGVIIIGSLLWDNSSMRTKWRKACLSELSEKIPVNIKIRYGRQSQTRSDTYTMIFSNHPTTGHGTAYILPFNEEIKNYKALEKQAFALSKSEGIWREGDATLNKGWGTVGLLLNPKVDESKSKLLEICVQRWSELYSNYFPLFKPALYAISTETPVIDKSGLLQIEWSDQMNKFDFLLATPVVPNPKRPLTAKEIADKMIAGNYTEYFEMNHLNGIVTFQDEEILKHLL